MHLSETMFVGLLSLGAIVVGAIIAGAKADGKRGAQLEQLIEGLKAIHSAVADVTDDIEQIRTQAAATTTAVAVHEARISDHDHQLASIQAARHHG